MSFYRIQRLSAIPNEVVYYPFGNSDGVTKPLADAGAGVRLDYMGWHQSIESTVSESGNRIAMVADELKIVTQRLVRPTYEEDAHFILTEKQADDALPEWQEWTRSPSTAEATGYFEDMKDYKYFGRETVAWWAIQQDVIWTRQKRVAENILGALVQIGAEYRDQLNQLKVSG